MTRPFPARLSRRQPRALRARPAHVRRAGCRPSPTPARCASPAGSARSPRIVGDAQEIYARPPAGRGGAAPHRGLYKPYHRDAAPARSTARIAASARRADRLPLDAVAQRRPATTAPGRHRARRPLRHQLRAGAHRPASTATLRGRGYAVARNKPYAGGFITEHYGEPAPASMRCRSRSTAPSTWTSGSLSDGRLRPRRRRWRCAGVMRETGGDFGRAPAAE